MVFCCYSEDSWEKTASDLNDVEAAAVSAVSAYDGNGIGDDDKATVVSGKISAGVDPVSNLSGAECAHRHCCGLSQILHADLRWLDVADRVWYKLGVTVQLCLHNKAPRYQVDCRIPVSDIASRQRLHSTYHCLLTLPRHWCSTLGCQAFSIAGPTVWNWLPDHLRDSDCTEPTFR